MTASGTVIEMAPQSRRAAALNAAQHFQLLITESSPVLGNSGRFDRVLNRLKDHLDLVPVSVYRHSSCAKRRASSSYVASSCRNRTDVRIMAMFTSIARLLARTEESIATLVL